MSREFQLKLISSTLEELGFLHLSNQLKSEIQSSTSSSSTTDNIVETTNDEFPRFLRHNIEIGNPLNILDFLNKVHGSIDMEAFDSLDGVSDDLNEEDRIKRSLFKYLDVEVPISLKYSITIIIYLIHRFTLLEKIIDKCCSLDESSSDFELINYLKTNIGELLDELESYKQANVIPSKAFHESLILKLTKTYETDVLLPITMRTPFNPYEIENQVFNKYILLLDNLDDVYLKHINNKVVYINEIRSVLSHHLFDKYASEGKHFFPHSSSSSSSSSSYSNSKLPPHALSKIIQRSNKFLKQQSVYYLPKRNLKFSDNNEQETEFIEEALLFTRNQSFYREIFPNKPMYQLSEHTDEVWFSKFSPLGRYLVTGSLDGKLVIYDVINKFQTLAILDSNDIDHSNVFVESSYKPTLNKRKGIIYCCWDANEEYLVSCCFDTIIRVWSIEELTNKNNNNSGNNNNKRITRSMDDQVKTFKLICCFTLGENIRAFSCEFLPNKLGIKPHFIIGSPDIKLKAFTIEGEEIFDFYEISDESNSEFGNFGNLSRDSSTNIITDDDKNSYNGLVLGFGDREIRIPSGSIHEVTNDVNETGSTNQTKTQKQFNRVNDIAITPNGKILASANNDKELRFYSIPDLFDPKSTTKILATIHFSGRLTSCSISRTGKYLLINIAPEELQVWDISHLSLSPSSSSSSSSLPLSKSNKNNLSPPTLKQRLFGHSQESFMIKSSFGYVNTSIGEEEIVITGSDTGFIYFWKIETGQLITRVKAHDGLCNCVDWNRNFGMDLNGNKDEIYNGIDFGKYWCSVGDDKKVKIWGYNDVLQ